MPLPIELSFAVPNLFKGTTIKVALNHGLTTFVGPNGSGKTQTLRAIKDTLRPHVGKREVRYLSAGRMSHIESYRSNIHGQGMSAPEGLDFGGKGYQKSRHQAESCFGDFHSLSARPDLHVKVAARLKAIFRREVYLEWDWGNLRVYFARTGAGCQRYPAAREASGLIQLVTLLAALYDDEVGALLIDEPEISLHPQLQAFLLREMESVAGDPDNPHKKLVVISTHSTEMVQLSQPQDLVNFVFFGNSEETPVQVSPNEGLLKSNKLSPLIARLGQAHKMAFFCQRPLLVEGPSDAIICSAIDRRLGLYLAAAGTQIVPVLGKDQMPVLAKLMKLIGKKPIVIADLDGFIDGPDLTNIYAADPTANGKAQDLCHESLLELANSLRSRLAQQIVNHWKSIAPTAEGHSYWTQRNVHKVAEEEKREDLAKRRAGMAILLSTDAETLAGLSNVADWVGLSRQCTAAMDLLEKSGCFFLRRGTIEDYYCFMDRAASLGKPDAAATEAAELCTKEPGFIKEQYADVVRAMQLAANSPEIDEAGALVDLTLAVAAPALQRLSKDSTAEELNMFARNMIQERAQLFDLSVVSQSEGQPRLRIDQKSTLLKISGFPLELSKGCNVIEEVTSKLKQHKA